MAICDSKEDEEEGVSKLAQVMPPLPLVEAPEDEEEEPDPIEAPEGERDQPPTELPIPKKPSPIQD